MTNLLLVYFVSLMHRKFNISFASYQSLFKCEVIQWYDSGCSSYVRFEM